MNNREFNTEFKREIMPMMRGASKCDLRCAWGDYLESAHHDRRITDKQVNRWAGPQEWQPK